MSRLHASSLTEQVHYRVHVLGNVEEELVQRFLERIPMLFLLLDVFFVPRVASGYFQVGFVFRQDFLDLGVFQGRGRLHALSGFAHLVDLHAVLRVALFVRLHLLVDLADSHRFVVSAFESDLFVREEENFLSGFSLALRLEVVFPKYFQFFVELQDNIILFASIF